MNHSVILLLLLAIVVYNYILHGFIAIEAMLKKEEHEVDGVKISVEVMDEEEPALATIVIDGITSKIDEDTLEMYFGNTKKSGGGEIESGSVQIDGTKGFVTFCDPQGNVTSYKTIVYSNITSVYGCMPACAAV